MHDDFRFSVQWIIPSKPSKVAQRSDYIIWKCFSRKSILMPWHPIHQWSVFQDASHRQTTDNSNVVSISRCPVHIMNLFSPCYYYGKEISRENTRANPQPPFTKVSLKITYSKLNWYLPGANEWNPIRIQLYDWTSSKIKSIILDATHICISNQTIMGLDNGASPCRCPAITWTKAWILLIKHPGTNFSEILR